MYGNLMMVLEVWSLAMQRTITLHLPADRSLVKTIEAVNVITNDIMALGFHAKVINMIKLHHLTYYPTRERYPEIPSSLVCAARDTASEMLKREKLKRLPLKRQHTSIRYNASTFSCLFKRGYATLSSIEGRIRVPRNLPGYFQQYSDWVPVGVRTTSGVHQTRGGTRWKSGVAGQAELYEPDVLEMRPGAQGEPPRPPVQVRSLRLRTALRLERCQEHRSPWYS